MALLIFLLLQTLSLVLTSKRDSDQLKIVSFEACFEGAARSDGPDALGLHNPDGSLFFCGGAQNKSGRTAVYGDRFAMHRL